MESSGIIYDAQKVYPFPLRVLFEILHIAGTGMIVAAVGGLIFTFGPVAREEIGYRISKQQTSTPLGILVDSAQAEQEYREFVDSKAVELGVTDTSFSIVVPKINAQGIVIANVSSADAKEYQEALTRGVAHAAGTVFPGMKGTTFLFAHSTDAPLNIARYNAVFYLLRELESGDEIFVFFGGKFYPYLVSDKKIVEPDDVSWITNAQSTPEQLVLQTCWPPGTTLKRLLVVAKPIQQN